MMVVMWVATEPFSKTLYVLKMMLYSVTGASSKKITGSNKAFIHAFFFYRFYLKVLIFGSLKLMVLLQILSHKIS